MEMMRERDGDDARVRNNRLLGERERERQREREGQRNELPPFTPTKLKKIGREMEEIRKLAMIYYAKLSDDQQQWTQSLFRKIDTNGDEKVSVQEFFGYFITGGSDYLVKLFRFLDKNHNGTLDFEECVTFFYMIASNRLLECDGCGSLLLAAYFLCVECYNANREETYNLCCSCYSDDNFSHEHSYFLDNYALLLQKEIKSNSAAECSSQKLEEPTGIFGLNRGVEYSYPRDPFLNYTSGQANSTRSTLKHTPRQAGSTRSKTGKIVDMADTLTNYNDMAGLVDNMAGLVHATLSKPGNTSQGSKRIKDAAHVFLTAVRMKSILSHVPSAAHVLVPAVPATWAQAVPAAAQFFGCALM